MLSNLNGSIPCPVVKAAANFQTKQQEADAEASQQKDAQKGTRNKLKDLAFQEEGFAMFWSGMCLKEREKSVNRNIRKSSRNSYETLMSGNKVTL